MINYSPHMLLNCYSMSSRPLPLGLLSCTYTTLHGTREIKTPIKIRFLAKFAENSTHRTCSPHMILRIYTSFDSWQYFMYIIFHWKYYLCMIDITQCYIASRIFISYFFRLGDLCYPMFTKYKMAVDKLYII